MSGEIAMPKKEKYDDWNVRSDVDTLIQANKILNDKSKLPKIRVEFKKRAEALKDTAKELNLESKVGKKLKKVFGSSHDGY